MGEFYSLDTMNLLKKIYILYKKYLSLIIFIATIIFVYITYIILNYANIQNFINLFILIYVEICLLISISVYILHKIKHIINLQRRRNKWKRFHKQIIILFSFVTIIPSTFIFIFALIFFNIGVEYLFKPPVMDIIDDSTKIANIYINDMQLSLRNYTNSLSDNIIKCIRNSDDKLLLDIINEETKIGKVDIMIFQLFDNNIKILAKSIFSLAIQYTNLPAGILKFPVGEPISYEDNDTIISIQKLVDQSNIFLMVISPLNQNIVNHRNKIKIANNRYTNLIYKKSGIKVTFMTLFFIITLLLLLIVILTGLIFANWILSPVTNLIIATNKISNGEFNIIKKDSKFNNEWDDLIITFNNMVQQLEHQRNQLIIYNKQIAWRDLARKIAHEIKNPLTPILLSAERIKNKYKKEITTSPEVFEMCLNTIIKQVNCISSLVKEFSDFARMPAPVMESNDLIQFLKEIVLLQSNAHKDIIFKYNFEKESLICKFDSTQINQVMMNLYQNAINSITEANINNIQIAQTNKNLTIGTILLSCFLHKDQISITIEDDGPGFSDIAMEKALEPYFTTRKAGNGLGLAIVYKIISDHGGEIVLGKSETLTGAKVSIFIPYILGDFNDR